MDAQTGEVSFITGRGVDVNERFFLSKWSVDGKSIFYLRAIRTGNGFIGARILERNLETGKEREIVRDVNSGMVLRRGIFTDFSLSPDGRRMAFITKETDTPSSPRLLKVKPLAGGEATELFRVQGLIILQGWTPDGRYILFRDYDGEGTKYLWRIPAAGGEPRKIELTMDGIEHLRVHPDGRQVAFDVGGGKKLELWVMENFLSESKASK